MISQITLKKLDLPAAGNLDEDIKFICKSFGFFTERDKQETAGKIFQLLVKEACGSNKGLNSDEIAERLKMSRGAIVHHLNNFIETGLVIRSHNTYRLRAQSLQKCIDEIRDDLDRLLSQLAKIASDIDARLGNLYR
jgi:DNA-binding MarR family transcriptional regulator